MKARVAWVLASAAVVLYCAFWIYNADARVDCAARGKRVVLGAFKSTCVDPAWREYQ